MKNIARFLTTFLTGVLFSVSTALATEVDTVDFQEDYNGYPCFLSMKSENGGNLTFQLSDYKDIWRLNLVVSNRALVFQDFFNNQGRYKVDEFSRTFTKVVLDGKEFRFHESSIYAVFADEIDDKSAAFLEIHEKHNVAAAVSSMIGNTASIPGLIFLEGVGQGMSEFKTCALNAMDISNGTPVETDYRAEYRMIFERSFEKWIASRAQTESCGKRIATGTSVAAIISEAGDAFYPGILKFSQRSRYKEDLENSLPRLELSGMADAASKGCFLTEELEKLSLVAVKKAILAASEIP